MQPGLEPLTVLYSERADDPGRSGQARRLWGRPHLRGNRRNNLAFQAGRDKGAHSSHSAWEEGW